MISIDYHQRLANISGQITRLFLLIISLFILFSFNRFLFFSLFSDSSEGTNEFFKILNGFLLGIKYDSATIIYGLSIPILLFYLGIVIPVKKYLPMCSIISKIWTTLILFLFLFIFCIDVFFYEFYQDHLNIIFFEIFEDDTQAVIKTILRNYPVFAIVTGLVILGSVVYYLLGKVFYHQNENLIKPLKHIGILGGSFIVFAIMARASFGLFPIGMMDAAYTDDIFLNKLAPNPVFTFEKAVEARLAQKSSLPFWRRNKYKDDIQSAFSKTAEYFLGSDEKNLDSTITTNSYFIQKSKSNEHLKSNPPHVIIVMMEGFGSWILDYESEEFQISCGISDWINKSIYFDHFIQAADGSIYNLTSTILSIPAIPQTIPLSQQKYSITSFESALAESYRRNGFETTFVYGGKLSWQRLSDFVPHQGFDHVYGEGDFDYNTPKTDWGVYDEYLFQFVFNILINSETPQFIVFFTTTNHPPFELPPSFDSPSLEMSDSLKTIIRGNEALALKRFAAYQYTSCYLNQFLNDIYTNEKLMNTVTAVTADHNLQGIRNYSSKNILHRFRIPFFILAPESIISQPKVIPTIGSHVDISPTLINLTLSDAKYLSFGRDLLNSNLEIIAVNQNGVLFLPDHVLWYDYQLKQIRHLLSWKTQDRWELEPLTKKVNSSELIQRLTMYYSVASFYLEDEWNKKSLSLTIKKEKN
ncbi:MAG TPA: alkaline phosphatase family protein [Candidatus Marinimicrobia bacterium]|nr:alkaline phosphatase family protein [Candidatus Neomarinimicrobiota bacterium]